MRDGSDDTAGTRVHRALGDPSRVRILEELRASAEARDAHELADRIGLHPNTIRAHLRVLAEAGLVTASAERRTGPGRPRLVFRAAADGDPGASDAGGYRLLAEILASRLAASGDESSEQAEEAGRAWGRYLVDRRPPYASGADEEDVDAVLRLLDEVGFEPRLEPADHGHTVLMQHCPFGEVGDAYRRIVCSVHLGLLQGALEGLGGELEADGLTPFVKPGICAAHLERVSAA
jgi:predicted ArsR family transcriptional regulator